jgi:hypothetical protein
MFPLWFARAWFVSVQLFSLIAATDFAHFAYPEMDEDRILQWRLASDASSPRNFVDAGSDQACAATGDHAVGHRLQEFFAEVPNRAEVGLTQR